MKADERWPFTMTDEQWADHLAQLNLDAFTEPICVLREELANTTDDTPAPENDHKSALVTK